MVHGRLIAVVLAGSLSGCSKGSEVPPTGEAVEASRRPAPAEDGSTIADAPSEPDDALTKTVREVAEPPPTVAVAATLTVEAELERQIHGELAFGRDDQWWHWNGVTATAYRGGARQEEPLDAKALLALEPRVAPGHAVIIEETLLTPAGPRSLPAEVAGAFEPHPMAHGGYELVATAWSADASRVALARSWRPSACCGREHDHDPPPRNIVDLFDTRSGEHVEIHGGRPLALSPNRLLVGGSVFVLEPLHPLHVPGNEMGSARALTVDPSGEIIARAQLDGELQLVRASDGVVLRAWPGPEGALALAFHPRVPLLAVASAERAELWRVDVPEPERLAHVPRSQTPHALIFDPEGARLVATGFRPTFMRVTVDEQPVGAEPTALRQALAAPVDASRAWSLPRDVDAVALGRERVHAYARGQALHTLELDSGLPLDSWVRRHPHHGVAAAARAPIFALQEDEYGRDPEAATQRLEILDASRYSVADTVWIPLGELDPLAISARGTAVAWSLRDDPIATLRAVDGSTRLDMHAGSVDVEAIAISEDDTRMAIANRHVERNVMVGTVGSTDVVVITTPRGVEHLLFSPDGSRLYVSDFDGRVHVTDPVAGTLLRTIDPGLGSVGAMAITADGERLVVGYGGVVVVLEIATGKELRRHAVSSYLRSLVITDDGSVIVVGTTEGRLERFAGR